MTLEPEAGKHVATVIGLIRGAQPGKWYHPLSTVLPSD